MKRALLLLPLALLAGLAAFLASEPAPVKRYPLPSIADRLPTVAIAPPSEALTFARTKDRTLLVTAYRDGVVAGLPVGEPGEDAITLVNRLGYDGVQALAATSQPVTAEANHLAVPVDLGREHVAAGTNYRDHADEAEVKGGPFLFPKYVTPTASRAAIPAGEGLLDYEVELCLVSLKPLSTAAEGGLMLCNDVTDRALLLRHVDPAHPESGVGFTTGKSAPGFLPVGDLFVVPRDLRAFVSRVTLQLSVNGEERQRAPATNWVWDLDRLLEEARKQRGTRWAYAGGEARLPLAEDGRLAARTLVLAGTPGGTVFEGISRRAMVRGVRDWLAGGWGRPVASHVVEQHIAEARRAGRYLQRGDLVTIRVDRLGALVNRVE